MAVEETLLTQVKRYCMIDTEEEDELLTLLTVSAMEYLTDAGVTQTEDARYTLAVCALVLHWHDHRGPTLDSQQASVPLGLRTIITQLKLAATADTESPL